MSQPWYPFYWSDYSGKTFDLTQGQHGAYMLLLRYYYTERSPIPHDQRFSIAKALLAEEQKNVDAVLCRYFDLKDGLWYNYRAELEIAKAENRHQARVNAGKKGGTAKASNAKILLDVCYKQKPSKALATTTTTIKEEDTVVSSSPARQRKAAGYSKPFEEFWNAYPLSKNKQEAFKAYERAINQGADHETIKNGAVGYANECRHEQREQRHIAHASTWLNGKRWENDYSLQPENAAKPRRADGYSIQTVLDKALADKTNRPSISPERAAALGLIPDPSDV